ncbi:MULTISPECIES: hypothetical protein [Caproicibacterium]|uniref:Copper resistance protein NlpE n=1 Tax=Caproicibacterium argilliputei TaxID=3030016 RepID=A0AA97H171_9FIRM|nr:hypothetical protein [Caproicibacterium argilliputei]WOC32341.1 hypothetical protein PXC00_00305 [Caproicibacterium argilliputei]
MKNKRFAALVMSVAIIFAGISFSGCGNSASAAKDDGSAKITESTIDGQLWNDSSEHYTYTFYANGKFTVTAGVVNGTNASAYTANGTYTLNDKKLTLLLDPMKEVFTQSEKGGRTMFTGGDGPYSLYTSQSAAEDSIAKGTGKVSSSSK